jgi:hypothetical protein
MVESNATFAPATSVSWRGPPGAEGHRPAGATASSASSASSAAVPAASPAEYPPTRVVRVPRARAARWPLWTALSVLVLGGGGTAAYFALLRGDRAAPAASADPLRAPGSTAVNTPAIPLGTGTESDPAQPTGTPSLPLPAILGFPGRLGVPRSTGADEPPPATSQPAMVPAVVAASAAGATTLPTSGVPDSGPPGLAGSAAPAQPLGAPTEESLRARLQQANAALAAGRRDEARAGYNEIRAQVPPLRSDLPAGLRRVAAEATVALGDLEAAPLDTVPAGGTQTELSAAWGAWNSQYGTATAAYNSANGYGQPEVTQCALVHAGQMNERAAGTVGRVQRPPVDPTHGGESLVSVIRGAASSYAFSAQAYYDGAQRSPHPQTGTCHDQAEQGLSRLAAPSTDAGRP